MEVGTDFTLKIEIQRGDEKEVRRIPPPKSFDHLLRHLVEWDVDINTSVVHYLDSDGDEVTIGSDMEWREALREVKANTFRIIVIVDSTLSDITVESPTISFAEIETRYPESASCAECLRYLFGCSPTATEVSRSIVSAILRHFGDVVPEVSPTIFEDIKWLVDNKFIVVGAATDNSSELFADRAMNSFIFRPSTRFPGKMVLTSNRAEGIVHLLIALDSPSSGGAKTLRQLVTTLQTPKKA